MSYNCFSGSDKQRNFFFFVETGTGPTGPATSGPLIVRNGDRIRFWDPSGSLTVIEGSVIIGPFSSSSTGISLWETNATRDVITYINNPLLINNNANFMASRNHSYINPNLALNNAILGGNNNIIDATNPCENNTLFGGTGNTINSSNSSSILSSENTIVSESRSSNNTSSFNVTNNRSNFSSNFCSYDSTIDNSSNVSNICSNLSYIDQISTFSSNINSNNSQIYNGNYNTILSTNRSNIRGNNNTIISSINSDNNGEFNSTLSSSNCYNFNIRNVNISSSDSQNNGTENNINISSSSCYSDSNSSYSGNLFSQSCIVRNGNSNNISCTSLTNEGNFSTNISCSSLSNTGQYCTNISSSGVNNERTFSCNISSSNCVTRNGYDSNISSSNCYSMLDYSSNYVSESSTVEGNYSVNISSLNSTNTSDYGTIISSQRSVMGTFGSKVLNSSIISSFESGISNVIPTNVNNCTIISGNNVSIHNARNCFLAGSNVQNVGTFLREGNFIFGDGRSGSTTLHENTIVGSVHTDNSFRCRFAGGYAFFSDSTLTTGVVLNPGSSSWAVISERDKKEDIKELNYDEIIEKLDKINFYEYRYKNNKNKFYGTMADEWNKVFSEEDNGTINMADMLAVSFACIKHLKRKLDLISNKEN